MIKFLSDRIWWILDPNIFHPTYGIQLYKNVHIAYIVLIGSFFLTLNTDSLSITFTSDSLCFHLSSDHEIYIVSGFDLMFMS